jgi:hypothetical protein
MAKINIKVHIRLVLVTLLFSTFLISLNNSSYALNMISAKKNSNMKIVDNSEAYIGIEIEDSYTVDPGNTFTFTIKNNLPYILSYDIQMPESYILKVEPNQFVLGTDGAKQVTVYVSENAMEGSYDTKGVVHAEWDSGYSDVDIDFETYVNFIEKEPPLNIINK